MITPPKTTLYQPTFECDRMYAITRGKVLLFRKDGAKFEPDGVFGPGKIIAQNEFLSGTPYRHLAVTAEESEIDEIDRARLDAELQNLPPEIGKVLRSLPAMALSIQAMEASQSVTNALPCFLFILNTFTDQGRSQPYRVADIADQMNSLFGIRYQDFCALLYGFQNLGLSTLTFDEENTDLLQLDNPVMVKQLYQYFRDRASPRPREGIILTKMEMQALHCLIFAMERIAKSNTDKVKLPYPQFTEAAKNMATEVKLCARALASLCLNNVIQAVPNLGSDLAFSERHSIVFKSDEIKQLLDLNELIPKATTGFWKLCNPEQESQSI